MHTAAIKGDQEGIKKLLEQGMSPNVPDFAGNFDSCLSSLMSWMLIKSNEIIIHMRIGLGWTPLHEACNHGHYNVAFTLVKAGANVNARGLDDDTPLHGIYFAQLTPLIADETTKWIVLYLVLDAAIVGQLRLVKMLVERGADPCFKNRKGKTPCDVAAAAVHNFLITARGEFVDNCIHFHRLCRWQFIS